MVLAGGGPAHTDAPRKKKGRIRWPRKKETDEMRPERDAKTRTVLFEAIKHGRLKARKAGRRTIILDEDYLSFLQSLPLVRGGS
jgi:hypothetical protein